MSIKNDPNRWMKKNKNFENEVEALKTQVSVIQESIQKIENKKKKMEDFIRDLEGTKQNADFSKLDAAEADKLKVTVVLTVIMNLVPKYPSVRQTAQNNRGERKR